MARADARLQLAVHVEGLSELRRDTRRVQPAATREIRVVIKAAAELVASEARTLAPRRSGALAESITASTAGDRGLVRSRLPYANVQEYGGTIAPRGTPIRIRAHEFGLRALESKREAVIEALDQGLDAVARRNGWR